MSRKNDQVSRAGDHEIDLVVKNENDMGAYAVEPLAGLMGLSGKDFIPPVAGGLGFTISTWAVNRFGGQLSSYLTRFAPLVGGVLGAVLNSVALPFVAGGNKKQLAQAAATSLTMGILTQVLRETQGAGMGAVVMERLRGTPSMGALPQVKTGSHMPRQIRASLDKSAYGKSWSN